MKLHPIDRQRNAFFNTDFPCPVPPPNGYSNRSAFCCLGPASLNQHRPVLQPKCPHKATGPADEAGPVNELLWICQTVRRVTLYPETGMCSLCHAR